MKKYIIDLSEINSFQIFESVLKVNRQTNLFKDLRKEYSNKVIEAIKKSGLKTYGSTKNINRKLKSNSVEFSPIPSMYGQENLGVDFCSGYGLGFYSVGAVSYQHRPYNDFPSLDTFYKRENFSIGNFGFLVENIDCEIEVIPSKEVKIVGFSYEVSKRKKKSDISIFGVHFENSSLRKIFDLYYNSNSDKNELIDVSLNTVYFPSFFQSRTSGKLFICNCFKGHIDWESDFYKFCNIYEDELLKKIENIEYLDGICHLCTKKTPTIETSNSEYSSFLKKYLPYFRLETKKQYGDIFHLNKEDNDIIENNLREYFGYSKIGEKWISETHLFNLVKELYPEYNPIFHYRGSELNGLELDIFIKELRLGIEYQGQQHYHPIKHWGGEVGLKKRKENDRKKIELCELNNYRLIEFTYLEDLTKELIIEKIEKN